ncbi:MAG: hypothetical protein Q7T87_06935 [Polaromonas sp.]|nr:hypothetical protein [Polaromonas sp.]
MNSILSRIASLFPVASTLVPVDGVARNLMERAEANAGRNPHQAQDLRNAACAYLSVIR